MCTTINLHTHNNKNSSIHTVTMMTNNISSLKMTDAQAGYEYSNN